jgi:hypothetical protein
MKRAPKIDPVLAALAAYRQAERADFRAYKAVNAAEDEARGGGFSYICLPYITVGTRRCHDAAEVETAARAAGFVEGRIPELVGVLRKRIATYRRERIRFGLAEFDAKAKAAREQYQRALRAVARARASTSEGVIAKLQHALNGIRMGYAESDAEIIASAIRDLKRLRGG